MIGCEGTSDDLDVPCEAVLRDAAFKQRHCLGTVNSVNIVRMLVQTVHFFYAYLRLVHKSTGDDDKEGGKVGPEEEESEEEEEEEAEEEEEESAGPELPQVGTLAQAVAAARRDPTGFRLPTIVPKSFQAAQAQARQHLELLRAGKLDSFDEMD